MSRLLALVTASLLLLGCSQTLRLPGEVYHTEGFSSPGTPYGETLRRQTRKAELYQGVDTVAKGWATWKTPDLRKALAETSIRAYRLGGERAEALRREAESASRSAREFHLALYMPKKQWNDLESRETLWRLELELPDGSRLAPTRITDLTKTDKTPVEYFYVSPWTREYAVLFPLLEDTDPGKGSLVLTGPLGTMRFNW